MESPNIEKYFAQRQSQVTLSIGLYALVDALLYARISTSGPLDRSQATVALFDGTTDASLADAGPWLVNVRDASADTLSALLQMGAGAEGVSWLISAYQLQSLADNLRRRLDVRMPRGRTALLRFYDARIIGEIANALTLSQRVCFFLPTLDWLAEINGKLTRVHPHA